MRISWFDIGLMAMILLLVGVHTVFALTIDGYTYPTSQTFTVLGKDFTYDRYANPITGVSTRFFCGLNLTNASTASMLNMNSSHFWFDFPLGVATDTHRIDSYQLVSGVNNNFTVEVNNGGATNGYSKIDMILPNGSTATVANINVVGATCFGNLKYTTDINISTINATHYLLNYTQKNYTCASYLVQTNVAHALPINSNISFAFARGGTAPTYTFGMYPHFACLNEYHPIQIGNWTTPLGFPTAPILRFYMSAVNYMPSDAAYVRSDFTTNIYRNMSINANYTPYYRAYLFQGSNAIQPKITYFPAIDAFGDFYNLTEGSAYLMNNTAAYVYDNNTGSWFLCPPLSISTWVTPYVMSCYYVSSNAVSQLNMSLLYTMKNCYQNGNNYSWFITSPTSTTFTFQQVYNNTTVINSAATGTTYSGTSQIQGFSNNAVTLNLTISANGNTICSYQNGTSVFGLGSIPVFSAFPVTSTAAFIIFLLFIALTAVIPFAAIPAFFMNDIFAFVNQTEMFYIFAFAGVIGVMINYMGERSLKSLGMYIVIGVAILFHYATIGSAAGLSGMPDLSGINQQITDMQTAVNAANLWSFSVSAIGLVISFGLFVLFFPATSSNFLFTSISYISPNLYTAVSAFIPIFTFGIYLWVALKLYEIISNRFRSI